MRNFSIGRLTVAGAAAFFACAALVGSWLAAVPLMVAGVALPTRTAGKLEGGYFSSRVLRRSARGARRALP